MTCSIKINKNLNFLRHPNPFVRMLRITVLYPPDLPQSIHFISARGGGGRVRAIPEFSPYWGLLLLMVGLVATFSPGGGPFYPYGGVIRYVLNITC